MTASSPLPDVLLREFEQLSLSPYEARILLALLRLGSGNTAQLARQSGVPRTSTYQVLEELSAKGLAQRLSIEGPAVWASPGRDEVFQRLDAAEELRLLQHRERTARLRDLVNQTFPELPDAAASFCQVIQGAAQLGSIYLRMLGETGSELLMFHRPPYPYPPNDVNPAMMAAVERGVSVRVLYQREQWFEVEADEFRAAMTIYHEAGVRGRLVDELPLKMAVSDRRAALLAMTDPLAPEAGQLTTLFVQHQGFASLQADAFERRWAEGRPAEAAAAAATSAR